MKLSIELSKWRCDRPDEWKMDEFIRNAEKLEAERDALVAHVESMKKSIEPAIPMIPAGAIYIIRDLRSAVLAEPQQHLAAHDAEVAAKSVESFINDIGYLDGLTPQCIFKQAKEYAAQLRAKAQQ